MNDLNYKQELGEKYHSSHYQHCMPQTIERWNWVLDRIDLNFGYIFSSISKDSLILDVACGVGYLEHYLLKKCFTRIHAIDLSEEQIAVAKKKLKEYGLEHNNKIKFEAIDAFKYLRKDNQFDFIAMLDLLEHLTKDKIMELLHLTHSALCNGGLLIIRVINADNPIFGRFFYHDFTHETPFTGDSMRQCLSAADFKVIKVGYEIIPVIKDKLQPIRLLKRFVHLLGLKLLGEFLGVSPAAFSENLVVVAKK